MHDIRPAVTVIGAGVSGLTCAIRLLEQGRLVQVVAEKRSPNTTSNRAGAVFTPFRIEGHDRAAKWTERAYLTLCELARNQSEAAGVSMTPMRELFFSPVEGRPWWTEFVKGYEHPPVPPPGYADVVTAIVPRMNMRRYMPWLESRVLELGGRIVEEKVTSLSVVFERGCQLIVNCSGLGARELASDPAVTPMRGQILHVSSNLVIPECLVEEGVGAQTTYVFPFDDYMVLGGTYERGEFCEATDEDSLRAIIGRCQAMLRACGYTDVDRLVRERLRTLSGLRPARIISGADEAVRLELESVGSDRWIIHNYGHGRAGVTLSWGCADDVVDIAESLPH